MRLLLLAVTVTFSYSLSLKSAVDEAIKHNPKINQYKQEYLSAKKDLEIAKAKFLPKLSLKATASKHKDNDISTKYKDTEYNAHDVTLSAKQNVYNGGADISEYRKREHLLAAAKYKYIEIINSTIYDVTEAYVAVLEKKDILDISKETYRLHEDTLAKAKEREESGIDVSSELEKVKSRKILANVNLLADRNNYYDAIYALESVINTKVKQPMSLAIPVFNYKLPKSLESMLNQAYKYNPTVIINKHNIKALRYDRAKAKSAFLPTVDLEVARTLQKKYDGKTEDNDDLSVMLTAEYNIFNGGADMNTHQQTQLNIIKEESIYKNSMRLINEGVNIAWMKKDILQKQLPMLKHYKKSTKSVVESYDEEFDLGRRTIIDVLDVKDTMQSAKVKYVETLYSILNTKYKLVNYLGKNREAFGINIDMR
jgi:adhesin transport system outer membrane protein